MARQAIARLGSRTLSGLLRETSRLDRMSKGVAWDDGASEDPWDAVLEVVITLAGGRRLKSAS